MNIGAKEITREDFLIYFDSRGEKDIKIFMIDLSTGNDLEAEKEYVYKKLRKPCRIFINCFHRKLSRLDVHFDIENGDIRTGKVFWIFIPI